MHHIDQFNYGDKVSFTPCSIAAAKWMNCRFVKAFKRRAQVVFLLPEEKWEAFDFRKAAQAAGFGIKIHLS